MLDAQKDKESRVVSEIEIPREGVDLDQVEYAYLIKALQMAKGNPLTLAERREDNLTTYFIALR